MSIERVVQPLSRIAALGRLAGRSGRPIPLVAQLTQSDCGAACLAMVLAHHGRAVSLDAARAAIGGCAQGVSARQLAEGARRFGLRARGIKLDLDKLRYLPAASILHWEMNHFVVFEAVDKRGARIVDPSCGPRHVTFKDLADRCTGVALLTETTPEFMPASRSRSPRRTRYVRWLSAAPGYWPRVLALSGLMQLVALSIPASMGLVVDKVVPRHDGQLLQLLAAGMLIVLSAQYLTSYVRSSLLLHLRTYMDARMTNDLNQHILSLPFSFFQQRASGDLVMRLGSSGQIRELLTSGALSLVLDGCMAIVYFGLLLALAPSLAAIALGLALAQALVVFWNGRRNAELMAEQLVAQARLSSAQVETLVAIEPIKSMGAEARIADRWSDLYVDVLNTALARGRLGNHVGALTGALGFAAPVVLLLSGAQLVLAGSLGVGAMLALSSVAAAFLTPVGSLVSLWSQLQTLSGYLERLEDVLDTTPERRHDAATTRPRLEGAVELREVSFAYDAAGPNVIDRLSLKLEPGEFVAIVGASGSGKSTLARLLAGLCVPVSGSLSFDGVDARQWDPVALRRMLGMVTQDPRLMAASIRDNITLFDPAVPLAQVEEAARQAEIHDAVSKLPLTYDTVLSDGGGSLSGGQRQRLSLARALLREPGVMVLDEATSQLDAITERVLHRRLAGLRCTRVVIAHRLSTVREADRIVVLEAGRIVDIGRHAELMARCPLYRALGGSQLSPASEFPPSIAADAG
jgi:ATP-binding cassette, subfamily B, bacterial